MKVNEWKKSLLLAMLAAAFLSFTAMAQEATPKAEVFGGYSYLRFRSEGEGINGHGFNFSVAGNFNKHVGLVAEVGRQSASERVNLRDLFGDPSFPNTSVEAEARLVTYLFGPRFSARSDKITAFAHTLFGGARGSGEATAARRRRRESPARFRIPDSLSRSAAGLTSTPASTSLSESGRWITCSPKPSAARSIMSATPPDWSSASARSNDGG